MTPAQPSYMLTYTSHIDALEPTRTVRVSRMTAVIGKARVGGFGPQYLRKG